MCIRDRATGLPCISFNCKEGPREIIKNGVNGFLIEEGNIDAYADGLLKLMEDIELRKKFAEEAGNDLKKYEIDDLSLIHIYTGILLFLICLVCRQHISCHLCFVMVLFFHMNGKPIEVWGLLLFLLNYVPAFFLKIIKIS